MKSENLNKKITSTEKEIENLQSRLADVDKALSKKKKSANFDKPDVMEDLKSLKSDRDLIQEVIEEKQNALTDQQSELEAVTAKENRANTISELIALAENAMRLEGKFRQKMSELDKILSERIPELVNIRQEWQEIASDFCNLADSSGLGKGFRESTAFTFSRNGKSDKLNADNLIDELEKKGTSLDAVLSDSVLRSQYFNHQRSSRPLEMNFREIVFNAMSQKNVFSLLSKKNDE